MCFNFLRNWNSFQKQYMKYLFQNLLHFICISPSSTKAFFTTGTSYSNWTSRSSVWSIGSQWLHIWSHFLYLVVCVRCISNSAFRTQMYTYVLTNCFDSLIKCYSYRLYCHQKSIAKFFCVTRKSSNNLQTKLWFQKRSLDSAFNSID